MTIRAERAAPPDDLVRMNATVRRWIIEQSIASKVGHIGCALSIVEVLLEARVCFGLHCRDVNGTPKVFSRDLYEAARPRSDGDLLDLALMVQAHRRGVPIKEIPIRSFKRHGGRSSTNLRSAWKMYAGALQFRLTGLP